MKETLASGICAMWSTSALRGQGRGAGVFGRGRSESFKLPVGASASLSALGDRVQNICI